MGRVRDRAALVASPLRTEQPSLLSFLGAADSQERLGSCSALSLFANPDLPVAKSLHILLGGGRTVAGGASASQASGYSAGIGGN